MGIHAEDRGNLLAMMEEDIAEEASGGVDASKTDDDEEGMDSAGREKHIV